MDMFALRNTYGDGHKPTGEQAFLCVDLQQHFLRPWPAE